MLEINAALPLNAKEIEATRVRMVDPTYSNATIAKSALEKRELERDRLTAAIQILQSRYNKAERHDRFEAVKPKYNSLVDRFNDRSEALSSLYRTFVEEIVPLLNDTAQLNQEIRRWNASSDAKDFPEFKIIPTIGEFLINGLVLPGADGTTCWPDPKSANQFAVAFAQAAAMQHSPRYSADWGAAKTLENEVKRADWARRNALQEEKRHQEWIKFEESKKRAAR